MLQCQWKITIIWIGLTFLQNKYTLTIKVTLVGLFAA